MSMSCEMAAVNNQPSRAQHAPPLKHAHCTHPPPRSYLNHTGFMFENAEEFGALLIFAEHRCGFGALLAL